jgi:hypothetical protein
LPGGKSFVVSAPANSEQNRYVQAARVNGQPQTRNFLTHAQISGGGELELELGPEPSMWGSRPGDLPSSLTSESGDQGRLLDRARGGVAAASEQNAWAAFDDDSRTEWPAPAGASWLSYRFPAGQAHAVSIYTVTSGGDGMADPSAWRLQTSEDGEHWATVDTRREERFEFRRQTRVFEVLEPRRACYYRFAIDGGGTNGTRIAELELLAADTPPDRSASRIEPANGCSMRAGGGTTSATVSTRILMLLMVLERRRRRCSRNQLHQRDVDLA